MMENRFAYLYSAYKRDVIDEIRKAKIRPFETMGLDELLKQEEKGSEAQAAAMEEPLHRGKLVIRLCESAAEIENPTDRGIICGVGRALLDADKLRESDSQLRADFVNQIASETDVTPQNVRKRLLTGTALPTIKRILNPGEPWERIRIQINENPAEK